MLAAMDIGKSSVGSWQEEDALATAVRGLAQIEVDASGEQVPAEEGDDGMSGGQVTERAALRRRIGGQAPPPLGRPCDTCRGPCRGEGAHFGQAEVRKPLLASENVILPLRGKKSLFPSFLPKQFFVFKSA